MPPSRNISWKTGPGKVGLNLVLIYILQQWQSLLSMYVNFMNINFIRFTEILHKYILTHL